MVSPRRDQLLTGTVVVGIWAVGCVCCAGSIMYFYGLGHSSTVLFPFKSRSDQMVAIAETAAAAMFLSLWIIWIALNRKRNRAVSAALSSAIAVEISLAVFSLLGLEISMRDWHFPLDLIFRSTFFAEYNWLTFVLEVAPVTSFVIGLLLFGVAKAIRQRQDRPTLVQS